MKKLMKNICLALFGNKEIAKQKNYVANHCCPNCGSEDVQVNVSIETNGIVATGFAGCSACESTWDDKYSLVGFENLKVPQQSKESSKWDEDAFYTELSSWKWDGLSIYDIRLSDIRNCDPVRLNEWESTVPTGYRNKVSYFEWESPVNSMEKIERSFKIIAVDQSGKALVIETRYNFYNDDESEGFKNMPVCQAQETFDCFVSHTELALEHS